MILLKDHAKFNCLPSCGRDHGDESCATDNWEKQLVRDPFMIELKIIQKKQTFHLYEQHVFAAVEEQICNGSDKADVATIPGNKIMKTKSQKLLELENHCICISAGSKDHLRKWTGTLNI